MTTIESSSRSDNARALPSMQEILIPDASKTFAPMYRRYNLLTRALSDHKAGIRTFLLEQSIFRFVTELQTMKDVLKTFRQWARFVRLFLEAYGALHTAMQESCRPEDICQTDSSQAKNMDDWAYLRDNQLRDLLNQAISLCEFEFSEMNKLRRTLKRVPSVPLSNACSTTSIRSNGGGSLGNSPVVHDNLSQVVSPAPSSSSRISPVPLNVQNEVSQMDIASLRIAYSTKYAECTSIATKYEEKSQNLNLVEGKLQQLHEVHKQLQVTHADVLDDNKQLKQSVQTLQSKLKSTLTQLANESRLKNANSADAACTAAAASTFAVCTNSSNAMQDALHGVCVNCLVWCDEAQFLDMNRAPGTIQAAHPLLQPFLYALYAQYASRERSGVKTGGEAELLRGWKVEAPDFHCTGQLLDDGTQRKRKMCIGRRGFGDCVEGEGKSRAFLETNGPGKKTTGPKRCSVCKAAANSLNGCSNYQRKEHCKQNSYQPRISWMNFICNLLEQHVADVQGHLEHMQRVIAMREKVGSSSALANGVLPDFSEVSASILKALEVTNHDDFEGVKETSKLSDNTTEQDKQQSIAQPPLPPPQQFSLSPLLQPSTPLLPMPKTGSTWSSCHSSSGSDKNITAEEGQIIDVLANLKTKKQENATIDDAVLTGFKRKIDRLTSTPDASPNRTISCKAMRLEGFGSQAETPTRNVKRSKSVTSNVSLRSHAASEAASSFTNWMQGLENLSGFDLIVHRQQL